jgi:hypothetical protein
MNNEYKSIAEDAVEMLENLIPHLSLNSLQSGMECIARHLRKRMDRLAEEERSAEVASRDF